MIELIKGYFLSISSFKHPFHECLVILVVLVVQAEATFNVIRTTHSNTSVIW